MTQKVTQKKIDEVANLWNKTKDEQYKNEWYKLIREFTYGKNINNFDPII
jgi:hypothetical protein